MAKYIRIKKSKNLRYKLISILYLLFISLSIIQIPIDWLRISPLMRENFEAVAAANMKSKSIEEAKTRITEVDASFSQLVGIDPTNGKLQQPENYALSDNFFINANEGKVIFDQLVVIKDSILALPLNNNLRVKFEELFAKDLENGLRQDRAQAWLQWKFQHVPATVARLTLSDLTLKLNLLLGEFELVEGDDSENPNFILAYNIDRLHIGDTAFFVYEGDIRPKLDLSVGDADAQEYVWENDTLVFMALDTGLYQLRFFLGNDEKSYRFKVLPGNFRTVENRQNLANYSGLALKLPLEAWQEELDFTCSCMLGAKPKAQDGFLNMLPRRSGWCMIEGFVKEIGALAFKDSIYIHPLPAPLLYTSGISDNQLSRSRLRRLAKIDLKVLFPDQPQGMDFKIEDIKTTLHFKETSESKTFHKELRFSEAEIENLQYIEIQEVTVRSLDGINTIGDRLILNVIGDEV